MVLLLLEYFLKEEPTLQLDGGCDQSYSTFLQHYPGDGYRITYCNNGDADQAEIATEFFRPRSRLQFRYAGYPEQNGVDFFLESQSGTRFDLQLLNATEKWRQVNVVVPLDFRDTHVRLVMRDNSPEPFSWGGLGVVETTGYIQFKDISVFMSAIGGVHITLMLLLSFFLRRTDDVQVALVFFLVGLGLIGYLAFWAYYAHIWIGIFISLIFFFVATLEGWVTFKGRLLEPIFISNRILLPATLYTFFILSVAYYPYNDIGSTFTTAANRWLQLPIDNWIPKIFADQIWHGDVTVPMLGDWHSSDRPPLQTGINLLFYIVSRDGLLYQAVSSFLQSLVLIPLFLLVKRIDPRISLFVLVTLGATSLMAVHTLFVWPKLLSAAYVIIFYLFTMTSFGHRCSPFLWWFLTGASAALAMLSHGGAIFALAAIAILYFVRSRGKAILMGLPAAIISVVLYIPWILYQRLLDPPGDRLVKWHLAGMIEPNNMSTFEALSLAYHNLNVKIWLDGRIDNFKVIFSGSFDFLRDFLVAVSSPSLISQAHEIPSLLSRSFFETFYSFWWFNPFFALAIWLLSGGWRKPDRLTLWLGLAGLLTLILWSILMFIPDSTVIHQGSFFSWLALFIFASLLLWQSSRYVFYTASVFNVFTIMRFYVFDFHSGEQLSYSLLYIFIVTLSFLLYFYSCIKLEGVLSGNDFSS